MKGFCIYSSDENVTDAKVSVNVRAKELDAYEVKFVDGEPLFEMPIVEDEFDGQEMLDVEIDFSKRLEILRFKAYANLWDWTLVRYFASLWRRDQPYFVMEADEDGVLFPVRMIDLEQEMLSYMNGVRSLRLCDTMAFSGQSFFEKMVQREAVSPWLKLEEAMMKCEYPIESAQKYSGQNGSILRSQIGIWRDLLGEIIGQGIASYEVLWRYWCTEWWLGFERDTHVMDLCLLLARHCTWIGDGKNIQLEKEYVSNRPLDGICINHSGLLVKLISEPAIKTVGRRLKCFSERPIIYVPRGESEHLNRRSWELDLQDSYFGYYEYFQPFVWEVTDQFRLVVGGDHWRQFAVNNPLSSMSDRKEETQLRFYGMFKLAVEAMVLGLKLPDRIKAKYQALRPELVLRSKQKANGHTFPERRI